MQSFDASLFAAGGAIAGGRCGDAGRSEKCIRRGSAAGASRDSRTRDGILSYSTTLPSPPSMLRTNTKRSNESRSSIGTCITATARRGFFTTTRAFSFFRCISIRGIREPVSRGETGHGRGLGTTFNVPVKAQTPAGEQKSTFEAALGEISTKNSTDLIFISAGFDAHLTDPLGQLAARRSRFCFDDANRDAMGRRSHAAAASFRVSKADTISKHSEKR